MTKPHGNHCACVVTLRHIAEALIDAIEKPAADSWADNLDAAVTEAKERLARIQGGAGL